MMARTIWPFIAVFCLLAITTESRAGEPRELFRIRIENTTGGQAQVSLDQGETYTTVGHVRRHAVALFTGFSASAYVPVGTVAATAVHGVRLNVGNVSSGKKKIPVTISLVPANFDVTPDGFGGHVPYGSGVYTDMPAGTAIFRNFAPFVGSMVKLEREGNLVGLPSGYQPAEGDVFVIIVRLPQPYLSELVFENQPGGAVWAVYTDGKKERVATVIQPVKGTGRFDGTSFTGVGLINTNHGGVVTISTASITDSGSPEGNGDERRGGFEIQPSKHALTQIPMPQAMVVGPFDSKKPLEGKPPIFSGFISLARDPNKPENTSRVQVSIRGGAWEPMPEVVGKRDNAFSRGEITGVKIVFPRYDRQFLARSLEADKQREMRGENVLRGAVGLRPARTPYPESVVTITVPSQFNATLSKPPFEYLWNTSTAPNGEYELRITVTDRSGTELWTENRRVVVDNPK